MRRPSCFFTIFKISLSRHASWLSISIVPSCTLHDYVYNSSFEKKDSSWCVVTVDIIYYKP